MYNQNIAGAINKKVKVSDEECEKLQSSINSVYKFLSDFSIENGIKKTGELKKAVLYQLDKVAEEYVKIANVRANFVNLEAINLLLENPNRLRIEIEKAKTVKKQTPIRYGADINKNIQLIVFELYNTITEYENKSDIKEQYKKAKKSKNKKNLTLLSKVLEGSLEERIKKYLIEIKEEITRQMKDSQIKSLIMTYDTLLNLGAIDKYKYFHNQQVVRIRLSRINV